MKKNFYVLFGITAVALASCSHSEYDGPDLAGGKLVVTGSVQQIISRASGAAWDANDEIGVSSTASCDNVKFVTATGDGVFSSTTPVYVLGDGEKVYTAYYPYDVTVNADAPSINFTEGKDFMWASATVTRENPHAGFVFAHKMAKISITVSDKTQQSTPADASMKLDGIAIAGSFNTLTGEVTASATKSNASNPFTLGQPCDFIVPVQVLNSNMSVMLAYNGKTYSGNISITSLASGTQYNYTIDLTGADPASELSISSATITDWNKTEGGNINVEEQETPKEENILEVGDFILKDGTVIDKNDRDFNNLKDQIAGVVFYVGNPQPSVLYGYNAEQDILKTDYPNCTNGLAIAINNANDDTAARFSSAKYSYDTWFKDEANAAYTSSFIGTNLNLSKIGERMLGYNDTKIVEKCAQLLDGGETTVTGAAETIAIVSAFNSSNSVAKASSWFIPSYAELNAAFENYASVKSSIEKAGGQLISYSDFGTVNNETFYWTSDFRGNSYNWVSPMTTVAEGTNLYLGRNSNGTKGFFRLTIAF